MALLELQDVSSGYGYGPDILNGISLTVNAGTAYCIIGPNGAGKSTLLLHLNGILPEFGGRRAAAPAVIRVFGEPISPANVGSIRRTVGLLFQDPDDQLFCPTVFEDVAFGPRQFRLAEANVREAVARALAMVGLAGFETRAPDRLSVGEKRRVCLAGILACEPRILVLDEPTSNLDPRGRRELKALLATIPATKIIATHDLELVVQLCTRAVVLDGGKIAADGLPVELLADEPLMLAHGLERPHILQHRHPH